MLVEYYFTIENTEIVHVWTGIYPTCITAILVL